MRRTFSILIALVLLGVLAACNQLRPPQGEPGVTAFPGSNGKIAFSRSGGGTSEIFVVNPDGSEEINLTNHPAHDDQPAWSPDGSKIAFRSLRADLNHDIYVMNADGSDPVRLTTSRALDGRPSWSPDGTRILFNRTAVSPDGSISSNSEIYVMNADGSNKINLTNHPTSEFAAVWSPDGSKIAFCRYWDSNWEIFIMDSDGSNPVNLTNDPEYDCLPSWSPDGNKIAFQSSRGRTGDIYVMNADGSTPTNLTEIGRAETAPVWSPDGTKILFESNRGPHGLFIMNADGTTPTFFLENAAKADWQSLPHGNRVPTANVGGPYDGLEGAGIPLAGSGSDPDGDVLTYLWTVDDALCTFSNGGSATPSLLCGDDGVFTVTLHVGDGMSVDTDSAAVSVRNRDPNIDSFGLDAAVIVVGQSVTAAGDYSDVPADTLTGTIAWGDGGTRVVASPFSVSHTYTVPGDYDVLLTVEDEDGGSDGAAASLRVLSPSEAIEALMEQIDDLELIRHTERSMLSLLEQAQNSADRGNSRATLGKLGAFIHQVEAQRGKKIAEADADALIVYAESIIAAVQDLY